MDVSTEELLQIIGELEVTKRILARENETLSQENIQEKDNDASDPETLAPHVRRTEHDDH